MNEELDAALVIRRLKREVHDLKEELRMLKGEDADRGPLTDEERDRLRLSIVQYCEDTSPEAVLTITGGMVFINGGEDLVWMLVVQWIRYQKRARNQSHTNEKAPVFNCDVQSSDSLCMQKISHPVYIT